MSIHEAAEQNTGPVYGVELLDSLPLGTSGMNQALPDRDDLQRILDSRMACASRVVAGYEILLAHYLDLLAKVRT